MPHPYWKGYIQLSLISVPVRAYSAINSADEIHLNQLHETCHSRIRYKKTCPIHGDVSNDEIVSGYEFEKGKYAVLAPEELSKLRNQSDKALVIDTFIPRHSIDPTHYSGKTYYLVPDGKMGEKPYALIVKGMVEDKLEAVAQGVISGKEQLMLLHPENGMLMMTDLLYESEIRQPEVFADEFHESQVSAEELKLATQLMRSFTRQKIDLSTYSDTYKEQLEQLIESKVRGKKIVSPRTTEVPQVINLMDALKRSVAGAGKPRTANGKTSAKTRQEKTHTHRRRSG